MEEPAMSGNFISSMFAFRTPKWITWNEIDNELEPNIPNELAYNVVKATGVNTHPTGKNAAGSTSNGLPAGYENIQFHTFAFEWTPTSVTWFVDGAQIYQFTGSASDRSRASRRRS